MYPLKFKSIYFEKIWGGAGLKDFKSDFPKGGVNIGESWELSCHKNALSVITNGYYKGKTLKEVIEKDGEKIIGKFYNKPFPVLIKFISSNDQLSIQVHPDDDYAKEHEDDNGKTEMWYIIKSTKNGEIILGSKEQDKEEFEKKILDGKIEENLNYINPKSGDLYYVEAGLIHGIGKEIVLLEIQQSSDITYRVYDFNRGRELHVKKALDVVNLNLRSNKLNEEKEKFHGYEKIKYQSNNKFKVEKYKIEDFYSDESLSDNFQVLVCIEGEGNIIFKDGIETLLLGETVMIPSNLGKYFIKGSLTILKIEVV